MRYTSRQAFAMHWQLSVCVCACRWWTTQLDHMEAANTYSWDDQRLYQVVIWSHLLQDYSYTSMQKAMASLNKGTFLAKSHLANTSLTAAPSAWRVAVGGNLPPLAAGLQAERRESCSEEGEAGSELPSPPPQTVCFCPVAPLCRGGPLQQQGLQGQQWQVCPLQRGHLSSLLVSCSDVLLPIWLCLSS